MMQKIISVVDYGVGNHNSILQSLKVLGYKCQLSSDPSVLARSDLLILPGVGAISTAMRELNNRSLVDPLRNLATTGMPLIGICLGMQILADKSLENGVYDGLGLIPGTVRRLKSADCHVGWNSIENAPHNSLLASSSGEFFYFNHSYTFDACGPHVAAVSHLHGTTITSAVSHKNIVGLQFHPEKSQGSGRRLLHLLIRGLVNA